jgi:excisionase family DNA binding protein
MGSIGSALELNQLFKKPTIFPQPSFSAETLALLRYSVTVNDLLTASEAASILHVSPETLRRWEQQGKLSATKTKGGHRRFSRSDVESYVVSQKSDGNTITITKTETCRVYWKAYSYCHTDGESVWIGEEELAQVTVSEGRDYPSRIKEAAAKDEVWSPEPYGPELVFDEERGGYIVTNYFTVSGLDKEKVKQALKRQKEPVLTELAQFKPHQGVAYFTDRDGKTMLPPLSYS